MFSRTTVFELVAALNFRTYDEINRFCLKFGLEESNSGRYVKERSTSIIRYLIATPDALGPNGSALVIEIIEHLVQQCQGNEAPSEAYPGLAHSLDRDGYELTDSGIRRKLPAELPLVEQEDQLIYLLEKHNFDTARGHYEQAVEAHARGKWASANAQLRSFVEEFFNKACDVLCPIESGSSQEKKIALTKVGFFAVEYNEFLFNGTGFVEGFCKRLHPQGSHPGLSESSDSTFRLHLVILVVHYFISRLDELLSRARTDQSA